MLISFVQCSVQEVQWHQRLLGFVKTTLALVQPFPLQVVSWCDALQPKSPNQDCRITHQPMAHWSSDCPSSIRLLWVSCVFLYVISSQAASGTMPRWRPFTYLWSQAFPFLSLCIWQVWWCGLDKEIENLAKSCTSCLSVKRAPLVASPTAPMGLAIQIMATGQLWFCWSISSRIHVSNCSWFLFEMAGSVNDVKLRWMF